MSEKRLKMAAQARGMSYARIDLQCPPSLGLPEVSARFILGEEEARQLYALAHTLGLKPGEPT